MNFINLLSHYLFAYRMRKAIRRATNLSKADGKRYMVLNIQGKPHVIPQAKVRALIKRHVFRKGTTIDDIRRKALFITK